MPDDRTLHGKFQGGLEEYVVLQDDGNLTDVSWCCIFHLK